MTPPSSRRGDASPVGTLSVWVQPNASRSRIVGLREDALKIAVTVPPEKGKANKAVEKLLAKTFRIPASAVTVVSGASTRKKTLQLEGVTQPQIAAWLEKQAAL